MFLGGSDCGVSREEIAYIRVAPPGGGPFAPYAVHGVVGPCSIYLVGLFISCEEILNK